MYQLININIHKINIANIYFWLCSLYLLYTCPFNYRFKNYCAVRHFTQKTGRIKYSKSSFLACLPSLRIRSTFLQLFQEQSRWFQGHLGMWKFLANRVLLARHYSFPRKLSRVQLAQLQKQSKWKTSQLCLKYFQQYQSGTACYQMVVLSSSTKPHRVSARES